MEQKAQKQQTGQGPKQKLKIMRSALPQQPQQQQHPKVEQLRHEQAKVNSLALDERIKENERQKRCKPMGVDKSFTLVRDALGVDLIQVPDIDPRWVDRSLAFMPYIPIAAGKEADAIEALQFTLLDLNALLELPYNRFWSTVIFEKGFLKFLDSFLRYFPRPWEQHYGAGKKDKRGKETDLAEMEESLYRRVFRVLQRIGSSKESQTFYMNTEFYVSAMRDHGIWDLPKILDVCSLYAYAGDKSAYGLVKKLFTSLPYLEEELTKAGPAIAGSLDILASMHSGASADEAAFFARDSAVALSCLLRSSPEVSHALSASGIIEQAMALFPQLSQEELAATIAPEIPEQTRQALIGICSSVIGHMICGTIARDTDLFCRGCKSADKAAVAKAILSFASQAENPLVAEVAKKLKLSTKIEILSTQGTNTTHETVQQAAATLRSKIGESEPLKRSPPPVDDVSPAPSSSAEGSSSSTRQPAQPSSSGSSTTSPPDPALEYVLEMFPGSDRAAIKAALKQKGGKVDAVITAVLDGHIRIDIPPTGVSPSQQQSVGGKGKMKAPVGVQEDSELAGGDTKGVYFFGKMPLAAPGMVVGELSQKDMNKTKRSVIAATERQYEEEKQEEEEKQRRSYQDEYDDSFDDFVRYGFKDGEALDSDSGDEKKGGESDSSSSDEEGEVHDAGGSAASPGQGGTARPGAAIAGGAVKKQGSRRTRGAHEAKSHHQRERAMRKRGMIFPKQ